MKKLLATFLVVVFVLGGTLAVAQITTTAITADDTRLGEFIGASDTKLEAMVGLVVDLFEEGLTKAEITNRIRSMRSAAVSDDLAGELERIRIRNLILRRGTSGEDVSTIQRVINNMGLNIGTVTEDGRFGPNTEAAIRAFQRFVGLNDDGVIGPQTRLKFEEKLGEFKLKLRAGDDELELETESED